MRNGIVRVAQDMGWTAQTAVHLITEVDAVRNAVALFGS
jgi:hypothetical protein